MFLTFVSVCITILGLLVGGTADARQATGKQCYATSQRTTVQRSFRTSTPANKSQTLVIHRDDWVNANCPGGSCVPRAPEGPPGFDPPVPNPPSEVPGDLGEVLPPVDEEGSRIGFIINLVTLGAGLAVGFKTKEIFGSNDLSAASAAVPVQPEIK